MLITEAGIAREAEAMSFYLQLPPEVQTSLDNRCNSNRAIAKAVMAKYHYFVSPSTIGRVRKHDPKATRILVEVCRGVADLSAAPTAGRDA